MMMVCVMAASELRWFMSSMSFQRTTKKTWSCQYRSRGSGWIFERIFDKCLCSYLVLLCKVGAFQCHSNSDGLLSKFVDSLSIIQCICFVDSHSSICQSHDLYWLSLFTRWSSQTTWNLCCRCSSDDYRFISCSQCGKHASLVIHALRWQRTRCSLLPGHRSLTRSYPENGIVTWDQRWIHSMENRYFSLDSRTSDSSQINGRDQGEAQNDEMKHLYSVMVRWRERDSCHEMIDDDDMTCLIELESCMSFWSCVMF